MWPLIDALLPIIALAGATGGGIWLGGSVWEWSRRKVYRFESMAAMLYQFAGLASNPHHAQEIRSLAFALDELGIPLPDSDIEMWEPFLEGLGNLAAHGKLARARKLLVNQGIK